MPTRTTRRKQQVELRYEGSVDQMRRYKEAQAKLRATAARAMRRYYDDPVAWAADCIEWPNEPDTGQPQFLTPYQQEVLAALSDHHRVAQRGPHSLGKSMSTSIALLWFALTRDAAGVDWKCITTAGGWHQLEKFLWPEIHKWAARLRWDKIGRDPFTSRELLMLNLNLRHGSAFAVASNQPARIEGAHTDAIFYVFDESKAIAPATFDAAEGAFAGTGHGREAFALASSTPGDPAGRFYDIHSHRKGYEDWWTRHVTLEEALAAGRVDGDWVNQRKLQWGEDSTVYHNRVLGEFFASDEDAVIPLAWIEAANQRWHDAADKPFGRMLRLGIDVAGAGDDQTVFSEIHGLRLVNIRRFQHLDTQEIADEARLTARANPDVEVIVEIDGMGVGVYDPLNHDSHVKVVPFTAGAGTEKRDKSGAMRFKNCLTGDARIRPIGQLQRIYRSWHDGPLVRVQLASGDEFTATPNHKVLTRAGWRSVKSLGVGDHLVSTVQSDDSESMRPDVQQVPPKISEVYSAACQLWGSERVPGVLVDFHGDRPAGEVDVVTIHRDLFSVEEAGQQPEQRQLVGALHRAGSLSGDRSLPHRSGQSDRQPWGLNGPEPVTSEMWLPPRRHPTSVLQSICHADVTAGYPLLVQHPSHLAFSSGKGSSDSLHGLTGQVALSDGRGVKRSTSELSCFGATTTFDPSVTQHSPQNGAIESFSQANGALRFTSDVPTDEVVGVEIVDLGSSGHWVYTLQTESGSYHSRSVVHKNCRAAAWWQMREMLDPMSGSTIELPDDDLLVGDLSAPRWFDKDSKGIIQVEQKEDIKARLGRSPDTGDSCVIGFYTERRKKKRRVVYAGVAA